MDAMALERALWLAGRQVWRKFAGIGGEGGRVVAVGGRAGARGWQRWQEGCGLFCYRGRMVSRAFVVDFKKHYKNG